MNLHLLVSKINHTVHRAGLRATFRKGLMHFTRSGQVDDFDLRHGTDTLRMEPLWKFNIRSPNGRFGVRYQATGEEDFRDAVSRLREDLQGFTFIDLGCGKGRALLLASQLGFKRVIGVEFAEELVEIARSNLSKAHIANATVLHGDAADFSFPESEMVVYLYNPFSVEVVRRVVANLASSSQRLYVIYYVPECPEVFDSSGFLSRFATSSEKRYIIWRSAVREVPTGAVK